ncbi:MAG: dynamin family protein [Pseudomonadota bacterium]
MNIETDIADFDSAPAGPAPRLDLMRQAMTALAPMAAERDALGAALENLIKVGDRATIERTRKLQARLADVEPAITMIGQVKAGKTSLVNAMIGMPGLLPSDVNPWTSVVTSLHLDPKMTPAQNKARFEFLGRTDWDRLVKGGGRIGELARRAGADSELARVTEQVTALQEKSKKRLGSKFEMLLGQDHDYSYFDSDLIERYVCLGDAFEDDTDTSRDRGRFADITKSAHIHMAHDAAPTKLCLRDTPGVNDTFLVREQITMKAIRGSQLCVVVLAAHQALSTVDLALVRLISNLQSRDVIIFVNRIDELADPATQVPEIQASIAATLKEHQGPADADILFGSADWASQVLRGQMTELSADSADALLNYTRSQLGSLPDGLSEEEIVWHLSGVSQLQQAVAERVAKGAGRTALQSIARSARNLMGGIKMSDLRADTSADGTPPKPIDPEAAEERFATLERESRAALDTGLNTLHSAFTDRIARVHDSYLDRATAALVQHLDTTKAGTVWNYDPTGLRMLLRSSYYTFAKRSKDVISQVFTSSAEELSAFFDDLCTPQDGGFELAAPVPMAAPEPVILGKTIALDLQSNWWATWWQKQTGTKAQTEEFRALIAAETAPILEALRDDCAAAILSDAETQLTELISEQRLVLERIAQGDAAQPGQTSKLTARAELLDSALPMLDAMLSEDV